MHGAAGPEPLSARAMVDVIGRVISKVATREGAVVPLPRVVDLMPGRISRSEKEHVLFAFQMLHGTLNNMILINPGPFSIHHPNTGRMLAAAMFSLIERRS